MVSVSSALLSDRSWWSLTKISWQCLARVKSSCSGVGRYHLQISATTWNNSRWWLLFTQKEKANQSLTLLSLKQEMSNKIKYLKRSTQYKKNVDMQEHRIRSVTYGIAPDDYFTNSDSSNICCSKTIPDAKRLAENLGFSFYSKMCKNLFTLLELEVLQIEQINWSIPGVVKTGSWENFI